MDVKPGVRGLWSSEQAEMKGNPYKSTESRFDEQKGQNMLDSIKCFIYIRTQMSQYQSLGELYKLRWSYIDECDGFIKLPPAVTKEGAKNNQTKEVPINYNVKAVLDSLKPKLSAVGNDHHDFVFTYRGQPIKRVNRSLKRRVKTPAYLTE